jgi:hypothetical protein
MNVSFVDWEHYFIVALVVDRSHPPHKIPSSVRVLALLIVVLKSGASDSEIHSSIEEFKEKFADYGRDRRSAMEFHLRNVERLLMPTTTTSLAMRALEGGGKFVSGGGGNVNVMNAARRNGNAAAAQSVPRPVLSSATQQQPRDPSQTEHTSKFQVQNKEPKELFKYLVGFLQVSPKQAAALKDSRHVARDLDDALAKSLSMLEELRGRLTNVGQDLDAEFSEIRSILTPRQAAKFLVWVANNGGTSECYIFMLLCSILFFSRHATSPHWLFALL